MGVGGEVEAVLTARDNMSAACQAAAQSVANLQNQLSQLGITSGPVFNAINEQLTAAKGNLESTQAAAMGAGMGIDKIAAASNTAQEPLNQMDRLVTRMVERLIVLYALRESFDFVVGLFKGAEALEQMSERLDMTTNKLQVLHFGAEQTGMGVNKMDTAVEHLNKSLAEGKSSTADALDTVGLSFAEVFALNPDERFDAIAGAIAAIPDKLQRTAVEVKLFGSDAIDPLIMHYKDLAREAANSNQIIGPDTLRILDNTVTAYKGWGTSFKTTVADIIATGQELVAASSAWMFGGSAANVKESAHRGADATGPGTEPSSPLTGSAYVESLRAQSLATKELTAEQKSELAELKELNELTADHAARLGVTSEQYKGYLLLVKAEEAAARAAATAWKEYQKAVVEVESAGTDLKSTINGIDGAVVESIKDSLAAGVSQHALAEYYSLTAAQVRAVARELAAEGAAAKAAGKQQADIILQITKLRDEEADIRVKLSGTTADIIIANEKRMSDNQAAVMKKKGEDTAQYESERADRDNLFTQLAVHNEELRDKNSRASFQQRMTDSIAEYQFKLMHADQFTAADIADSRKRMEQARLEAQNWRTIADIHIAGNTAEAVSVHTLAGEWITAAQAKERYNAGNSMTYDLSTTEGMKQFQALNPGATIANVPPDYFKTHTLQQAVQAGIVNLYGAYQQQNRPPGFADGGDIKVGEHGEETVRIIRTGYGGGMGGGSGITVPITVSGIWDPRTKQELGDMIESTIERLLRQNRQLPGA